MKNTNTKTPQKSSQKQGMGMAAIEELEITTSEGLRILFINELKEIYWTERALSKALPSMINNATSPELIDVLSDHLEITKEHVTRLEMIFSLVGEKAVTVRCQAMAGLFRETEMVMNETSEGTVRDAGIISASRKVEYYGISTYTTLCSYAKTLKEDSALSLLEETLNEEKEVNEILGDIAESFIDRAISGNYAQNKLYASSKTYAN